MRHSLLDSLTPQSIYSTLNGSFAHRCDSLRIDIFTHFVRNIYNNPLIKRGVVSFIQSLSRNYECDDEPIRRIIYPPTQ